MAPLYGEEDDYKAQVKRLSELQNLLYAHNRYWLLLIFQAMDAAGKDSIIKHMMSCVNPQGCQVVSFKHPSAHELDHDFLWRTSQCLPEHDRIGIFHRSDYEEVLIVLVHPEIQRAQSLPLGTAKPLRLWKERPSPINNLEAHLHPQPHARAEVLPAPFQGRAAPALPEAAGRFEQELEVQRRRPRLARAVAQVHAGLPRDAASHEHRRCAPVHRPRRR